MKTSLRSFFLSLAIIASCTLVANAGDPKKLSKEFNEINKPGTAVPVAKSYGIRQFLRASLFTSSGLIADGNAVAFDDMFSNGLDVNDAHKIMNFGENFGITCDAELLSVEARSPVQLNDTIFYNLQNLAQQDYQLRFKTTNMETSALTAYLVDRYTQTSTFISFTDTSFVNISITADAASAAADRLILVFTNSRMRELNFISFTATWNIDKSVDLKWRVENERNVDHYTIERSSNGIDFTSIGTKNPTGNNGSTQTYDAKDVNAGKGGNYYRISAHDQYGLLKYSIIVNSGILEETAITIYPNPVKDKIMNIHFVNQAAGKCKLQLSNKMGQVVYSGEVEITMTNEVKTIRLDNIVTIGTYQLIIIPATGNKTTRQVMIR